jgi:hypothetical protein
MHALTLEQQLATPAGFAKRVKGPDGLFRVAGQVGIIGVLVAAFVGFAQAQWVAALTDLAAFVVIALVLCLAGIARSRISVAGMHTAYLGRGWIAAQSPIGFVKDSSDEGNGVVLRDLSVGSGTRVPGSPIVLVGGRHTLAAEVDATAATVRAWVLGITDAEARVVAERVHDATYDGRDASAVLPDVPTGMHLAAAEGLDPLVLAVAPSETGRHSAIRHYRLIG